jgi:hypothetical protein
MERFDLEKLNDVEVKKEHRVKIWSRFARPQQLDDSEVMNGE